MYNRRLTAPVRKLWRLLLLLSRGVISRMWRWTTPGLMPAPRAALLQPASPRQALPLPRGAEPLAPEVRFAVLCSAVCAALRN